eukprot:403372282
MGNKQDTNYQNYAYRVMKIQPNSPAERSSLCEFSDFILYSPDENNNELFSEYLFKTLTKPIILKVYNMLTQSERDVEIIPKKLDQSTNYLGAELQFEEYQNIHEKFYKIFEVVLGSPADKAGFQKIDEQQETQEVYIAGAQDKTSFSSVTELGEYLGDRLNKETIIYVYKSSTQTFEEKIIIPSKDWEGFGILGCHLKQTTIKYEHIPSIRYIKRLPIKEQILHELPQIQPIDNVNLSQDNQQKLQQNTPQKQGNMLKTIASTGSQEKPLTSNTQVQNISTASSKSQDSIEKDNPIDQQNQNIKSKSQTHYRIESDDIELSNINQPMILNNQNENEEQQNNTNYQEYLEKKQIQFNFEQKLDFSDQTILFHRSDGKQSEFLFVNV